MAASALMHLGQRRTAAVSASFYPRPEERTVVVTDVARVQYWSPVRSDSGDIDEYVHLFSRAVFHLLGFASTSVYVFGSAFSKASIADARLVRLLNMKDNWDGYGSEAPGHIALYGAGEALAKIDDYPLTPARIVPSAEGGVSIVFSKANRMATIEFLNTGEILVSLAGRQTEPQVSEVTLSFITGAIERICAHLG